MSEKLSFSESATRIRLFRHRTLNRKRILRPQVCFPYNDWDFRPATKVKPPTPQKATQPRAALQKIASLRRSMSMTAVAVPDPIEEVDIAKCKMSDCLEVMCRIRQPSLRWAVPTTAVV